jgi:sulfocyanin SoxE-like protein
VLAACNPVTGTGQGTPPDPKQFLQVDAAGRSAVVVLIAAYPVTDYQFNYNGYRSGQLVVTVPAGWTLTVQCQNRGTVPNSCTVVRDGKATAPVEEGWTTPDPLRGIPAGASASFSFSPAEAGRFRIASLPQGHEASGMWATLVVTDGGVPSIELAR